MHVYSCQDFPNSLIIHCISRVSMYVYGGPPIQDSPYPLGFKFCRCSITIHTAGGNSRGPVRVWETLLYCISAPSLPVWVLLITVTVTAAVPCCLQCSFYGNKNATELLVLSQVSKQEGYYFQEAETVLLVCRGTFLRLTIG